MSLIVTTHFLQLSAFKFSVESDFPCYPLAHVDIPTLAPTVFLLVKFPQGFDTVLFP
jgi:hypothetical protein